MTGPILGRLRRRFARAFAAATVLAAVLPASASAGETIRTPASGTPSLSAEAPEGWTTGAAGPFVTASAPGDKVRLALAVEGRPSALALPKNVLALSLIPPSASIAADGTARIGGVSGEVFKMSNPDGRILIGGIGPQHLAIVIEVSPSSASGADRQALRTLEDSIRVAP